jgi:hypothetical protein
MLEIVSYYKSRLGKTIPAQMRKGLAKAFDKFDNYQIAKYRGENKDFKLIDLVNLVHPIPVEKNNDALKRLVEGTLRSTDTWEAKLTDAGKKAKSEKEKDQLKDKAWTDLISERKIGYFALLRNLRNIFLQSPQSIPAACSMLRDPKLIKKSLVFPFRYIAAMEELTQTMAQEIFDAINDAIDISCDNIPEFDGKTLVVVDYSGSMGNGFSSYRGKGTLFGIAMMKKNDSDFMIFGNDAEYIAINKRDTTTTIFKYLTGLNHGYYGIGNTTIGNVGHGTNMPSIFEKANKKYDRIVIFSDMQSWVGGMHPGPTFNNYKKRHNASPYVYAIDLMGSGTMQFPENNVFTLAGFSDKIFDLMKKLESDKNAMVNTIEDVELR